MLRAGVLAVLLCCLPAAFADIVHLKNGRTLTGEVIQDDGVVVVVRVAHGTIKLRASQVERIERQTPVERRLSMAREQLLRRRYDLALETLEQAPPAQAALPEIRSALAETCAAYGQRLLAARRLGEARACFERLRSLRPDSQHAREGLAALDREARQLESLLIQARVAWAAREWDAAIKDFQAAINFSPDALARAGADMALAYAQRAEEHYRAQRFEQAAGDLEQAFSLDASLATRWENLYAASALSAVIARAGKETPAQTRAALAHILEVVPANRQALYVAGRLEEDLHSLPAAARLYGRALQVRIRDPSQARVAELRRELERLLKVPEGQGIRFRVEAPDEKLYAQSKAGEFSVLEHEPFVIYHHNDALAAEVARSLDAHLARIQEATGLTPDWGGKVKVFIHRDQGEYTAATGQGAWSGGMSRFVITPGRSLSGMELHSWQTSPRLLNSVLPHELTHLLLNSRLSSPQDLPRALHEGLAILMEPAYRQGHYLSFLRDRLKNQTSLPLDELLARTEYPPEPDFFYAQSFALVAYLVQQQGLQEVLGLLQEGVRGQGLLDRLVRLAGARSAEEFESDWLNWVKGRKH
jgi:tetratricopeptide (TPR) repeat protein